MGLGAGSDRGTSGRRSARGTESVGAELGICMEGTSLRA